MKILNYLDMHKPGRVIAIFSNERCEFSSNVGLEKSPWSLYSNGYSSTYCNRLTLNTGLGGL